MTNVANKPLTRQEEVTATAHRMMSMYKTSNYSPEERSIDHAFSYDRNDPQYLYWLDVYSVIRKARYTQLKGE